MKAKRNSTPDTIEILIVEDSPTQAEQLKYLLEQQQYKVLVANSGKQALAILNEHKPSMVITDIVMPEMNGYELCKQIKSDGSKQDIPVILLTSLSNSEDVLEGLACGADNFITKPYSEEYLLLHVEQILANKKMRKNERVRIGVEIMFGGKRRFITADQQQILTLLISTYEAAVLKNRELIQTQNELKLLNEQLEEKVEKRTAALAQEVAVRKTHEEQIQNLNRVLSVLSSVNQTVIHVHDTGQLFKDICRIAIEDGRFQSAWIGKVNSGTRELAIVEFAGTPNEYRVGANIDLNDTNQTQTPAAISTRTGKHLIWNDVLDDATNVVRRKDGAESGSGSMAAFPIRVFGEPYGVINLSSNEIGFFDEDEVSLLDEMAMEVSFALEYIEKETERKQAERLTEALYEISKAIYTTEDVNELFRHIHRVLSSILPANNFFIALLTDDGKTLYFPYKSDEKDTNDRPAIGVDDSQSLTVEVLKTKRSLLLDETELIDRYATGRNKVWGTMPKCWLGVPLMMREAAIGVMAVQDYHKSGAYSQKDVTLFESAGGQIAIAIERKRAEEALRESEHRTRTFLDSTSDMAFLKDDKFRHLLANRTLCKFYGKTEDEIIRKKDFDLMSEKAALRSRKTDEQTLLSNALTVYEELIGDRHYETVKFPVEIGVGKVGVGGYIRDITERKKFEHDLRLSEERFRSVWDNSADGMRLTDREGRIIDANAAFCKLVRMPREELLGNVLSVAYQREGPDDDLNPYHERFDARETISNLFGSATLRDGESIDFDISSSFIESAGQEKLLLSLFRDVTEKRKSEKRLENERNLLRTIIDAIPDEIAVKDTERRFFVVNTGTVNAFQRASADEIIGKKDEDLVHGHLVKDWSEEENTVLAGGECSMNRIANKINPETGALERSLMVSKVPLKDHEGKIIGLVGINRDITALKQAEEMLEKERTLLLTLIENIPDEVCLKDLRHRYLTANRAAMKALGVTSLEALIGKTDQDFAPQGLAQEHFEEEEAILESGKPLINRERIKIDPQTGRVVRCLLTTKVPVKDNTGAAIGILVVNRHITERKQMEELLRASEEKFRALFEESKDLVYFSTGGGRLLDINPAGIELLGYASKQEILSIDMANEGYADSEDKRRFDRQMAQHGFVKDYEVVLRRKDGGKVTVLETATAVMDSKGNIVQYRGVMRDVTKQRQLERQFLQAQKMDSIGTLAGGIAHDFNNILGIILGHLALLERTREKPAQFDESVFSINRAVERGASLVRQILTFARKTEAELEPVNINSAAKELAKMVEETFPKLITVTLRLDKTIPVVSMDPTQLHQALLNLCVNARDAMSGQGTLTIATHLAQGRDVSLRFPKASSNHYVQVSVSDTGTGMDEETRQRIFEPFFTTKEKGKGTGLGLAVVYGVLQVHNGFVDVESTPGAGSTFHLFVPVPEGIILKSVKEAVKNEDLPGGTETILVVEDEDILRDILTKLLEMHGYTVIAASDGVEAVSRFSEHEDQIDLLLSDMGLPKRSGWDAFKLMQKTKPGVRAVMASGYIEPGQKSEILKSGVRRFISKPYRMEEVLKAIRETLDEKE